MHLKNLFLFFFKGGRWCLLYFSSGNPEAQGEDEQGRQEEKEEVQDKVYTNVNNASVSVSTLNSWNIKELHFVHYTKLLASSEYRMDPYFPSFAILQTSSTLSSARCPNVLVLNYFVMPNYSQQWNCVADRLDTLFSGYFSSILT